MNKLPEKERAAATESSSKELLIILAVVMVLSSAGSHAVLGWTGYRTDQTLRWTVGTENSLAPLLLLGSSTAYRALSLPVLSERLNRKIANFWVPSSSSVEMEQLSKEIRNPAATLVVISLYDQNEAILSDHRALVVPLGQAVRDLWQSGADWRYAKRVVSQYPLKYVRILFPTAGRSLLVMLLVKSKILWLLDSLRGQSHPAPEQDPYFEKPVTGNLTTWSQGQLLDQVSLIRVLCQGKHEYHGPKHLALQRLLGNAAAAEGKVIVIVLPVSPEYEREFIDEKAARDFEQSLAEARRHAPQSIWVRLDQEPGLKSSTYFQDLGHMNSEGQRLATAATLRALKDFRLE